jgi:dihydropteroate synthase
MAVDHKFYGALRADIDAAFKQVAARHGLKSLDLGRISIDPMGGFRATVQGVTATGASPEESNYNTTRRYSDYALPAIGEEVTIGAQRWRIIGQKTRGNQRIIADKVPQGGRYLLPVESFERRFARKPEEQST